MANHELGVEAVESTPQAKPYSILGAGHLTSHLWKRSQCDETIDYRFNLFRTQSNGRVTQLLRPQDVLPLAKFVRVISQVLADDGCTSSDLRGLLAHLAVALDEVLESCEVKQAEAAMKSSLGRRDGFDGS